MASVSSQADAGPEKLLDLWSRSLEFDALAERLSAGPGEHLAYGLSGSEKAFLVAGLCRKLGRTCLYVTATSHQAERVAADLAALSPASQVMLFPQLEILPYDILAQGHEVAAARLAVFEALTSPEGALPDGSSGKPRLTVVAPVDALMRRLAPPAEMSGHRLQLTVGLDYDHDALRARLVAAGYESVETVETPGQFAVRGGILDVFPLTRDNPLRAEFYGDSLESLRVFDPVTQRSSGRTDSEPVFAASEFLPGQDRLSKGLAAINLEVERAAASLRRAGKELETTKLRSRVEGHLERFAERDLDGLEQYLPFFYEDAVTLFEYLPDDSMVVFDEPARLKETVDAALAGHRERYAALLDGGAVLPRQADVLWDYGDLLSRARSRPVLCFSLMLRRAAAGRPDSLVAITARPMANYHGQWQLLSVEVRRLSDEGRTVALLVAGAGRAERLAGAFRAEGVEVVSGGAWTPAAGPAVVIFTRVLDEGFEIPSLNLAVITETDIHGRPRRRARPRQFREARRISSHLDLKVGDYVVHVNHGIARYVGVTALEVEGVRKDYLFLKYAGEDRLYVPTDQVELIQRYVGGEGHEPKLNRLGGAEWSRTKARVRESVQVMARELLELYAGREVSAGHAYAEDTSWQGEFEDSFPYEETPDQLRSITEIKADMEAPRPMDRLLCGDVGYGKTEVAIRAAFKAVMDGKQAAVLVPTTILAQQHFSTFRERFAGFPATIELLSRFRSVSQQRRTVAGLRSGRVDIAIGTHRLLSEDVSFHDLGLLVVDEEHRFGVAQKERIKQWRKTVDVLSLSATPIPRTLHMALGGVRDMSVIETPPEDRFPVQTYVLEYSDELVRDAILRELARGGQVFYVHNRIQTIDRVYSRLSRLVPEAQIAIGHGQMAEDQLEQVMISFLEREYDILLCTTIIESGLDMANVNTLIVEDADYLGLAQLYQLRGRVGRSSRLAFAYFTYHRDKVLTEQAEKRLDAIRQFTELGSGFKIALRDLEIRGMGNLLGTEQHGFMAAVGLDLYIQLLQNAVSELRGRAPREERQASVEISVDAYIPETYISDPGQKVTIYRRLAGMRTLDAVEDVAAELADRFGPLPRPARNLLKVARLRVLATRCGIESVVEGPGGVHCRFGSPRGLSGERLVSFVERHRNLVSLRARNGVELRLRLPRRPDLPALGCPPSEAGRPSPGEAVLDLVLDVLRALFGEVSPL